ncbi:MAG: tRNA (guanine(46)-N(7))-methyltransferase TrmB, partial [Pseudomonadota bacterium]
MTDDGLGKGTPGRHFFGRRAGKSLTPRQSDLMAKCLPKLAISLEEPAPCDLSELFGHKPEEVWLESGFGAGEHLVHRALANPDVGFIGVEPFRNGMAKALTLIEETGVSNIRLYHDESGPLLDWIPASSLSRFYLLYPDPWPKKRHFKRRFVTPENLNRIARVLKAGAPFYFASDIDSYVSWTLEHMA